MRKIQYIPFAYTDEQLKEKYIQAFEKFLNEKWYILGKEVEEFENQWAAFCRCKFAVGVGNGYDALFLSLKALDIQQDDEIIVPSHTFAATALAVLNTGAIPVLVETDPSTFNMDVTQLEAKISDRTKGIIAVHLYGNPCEIDTILQICNKYHIHLIEDNAQAHGAAYKGKVTGSFGIISATSFYPIKNMGALGDAGIITTNTKEISDRIKLLRNYGSPDKHKFEYSGVNSRLDEFQAMILNLKLPKLMHWNQERQRLNLLYRKALGDIKEIQLCHQPDYIQSANHIFPILTEKRDDLRSFLLENGIQTLGHYPRPYYLEKAFDKLKYKNGAFPITENICAQEISLPIFPGITDEDISFIANTIRRYFNA